MFLNFNPSLQTWLVFLSLHVSLKMLNIFPPSHRNEQNISSLLQTSRLILRLPLQLNTSRHSFDKFSASRNGFFPPDELKLMRNCIVFSLLQPHLFLTEMESRSRTTREGRMLPTLCLSHSEHELSSATFA